MTTECVLCNFPSNRRAAVAQSVESSAPAWRARVRGSLGEKPAFTLMAPGAYTVGSKIIRALAIVLAIFL